MRNPRSRRAKRSLVDDLLDRGLHRQHRRPEQPVGVRLAVIREPAVVGAAGRRRGVRVFHPAQEQSEARVEEGGVDSFAVHVDDARVRIETALAPFEVRHAGVDLAVARADRAEHAERRRLLAAAPQAEVEAFVDEEALVAFGVDDEFGAVVAVLGIDVPFPQIGRLQDVAVRVDDVVFTGHHIHLVAEDVMFGA